MVLPAPLYMSGTEIAWTYCLHYVPIYIFRQQFTERPHEEWMREKRELERKMAELQTTLQEERRVSEAEIQMWGQRNLERVY